MKRYSKAKFIRNSEAGHWNVEESTIRIWCVCVCDNSYGNSYGKEINTRPLHIYYGYDFIGLFAWKVRNTRGQHEGADPSQQGAQRDAVASRLYLVPRFQADKFSFLGSVLDG